MVLNLVHMVPINELTAAAVRDAKKAAGATIESLSDATGIPTSTLKRRLNGQVSFGLDQIVLIAIALDVPFEQLIPTSDALTRSAA